MPPDDAEEPPASIASTWSNQDVRNLLVQRAIVPERLPAAEDVKKVERRLLAERKRLGAPKGLPDAPPPRG